MKSYLSFATDVAEKTGKIILQYFLTEIKKEWKEDNTPVTVADIAVNKLVIESVINEYPTYGILGEEESLLKESDYIWVCDPIDGTYSFAHGIPVFTFSLALTHHGEPIVAVVYDPVLKRMFTAEKGKGAYMNSRKISVSNASRLERQFVSTEGRKLSEFNQEKLREALSSNGVILSILGSLTYTNIMVALGEFVGSVYSNPKAWDCAAVKLLIEEAGGKTSDLFGNEQRYDKSLKGFITSNGQVHNQLVEIVSKTLIKK